MDTARANRILTVVFFTAVAISVIHYTDNYFNFEDYPTSDSLPNPSQELIGIAWLVFTAVGSTGYVLFRRGRYPIACLCLGFYAGSGLVGFGHYATDGMTGAVWWRQAHVVADILLGIAVVSLAVYFALNPPRGPRAA